MKFRTHDLPGTQRLVRALPPALLCLPLFCLSLTPTSAAAKTAKPRSINEQMAGDAVLNSMNGELRRAATALGKLTPAAYFISYTVRDEQIAMAAGTNGGVLSSAASTRKVADVTVRVGSATLDNSHGTMRPSAIYSETLPLDGTPRAVEHALWRMTANEYRRAATAFLNVATQSKVNAKDDDLSADFSQEAAQTHRDYRDVASVPEQKQLEQFVRRFSQAFQKYPYLDNAAVAITAQKSLRRFVSTEGASIVTPETSIRVVIQAQTRADDGMELLRVETMQASALDQLPAASEIDAKIERMVRDLAALRQAPVAEPYDGPALLSGRAAGVFFHEVFGHRLEGQRQRGDEEGQTFTKKVNQTVLPDFLSVVDDPTQHTLNGVSLAGWYEYDDEGVQAQRVEVIHNGVLRNFLMSRMPIEHFAHSNGHGRAQAGYMPVGRQGNLIVSSTKTVPDAELRQQLIAEVKRQNKPYGLYFEDIQGGFTLTKRAQPQAFQVLPVMVWKVYADGRPDQLVRGVDIVGTPLAAMSRILLTGTTTAVFNGVCGAESGSVPVSAAAPAMLFSEIEVQKKAHSKERPPILPPPGFTAADTQISPATSEVQR